MNLSYSYDSMRLGCYDMTVASSAIRRRRAHFIRVNGTPAQLVTIARLCRYIIRKMRGTERTAALKKAAADFTQWKEMNKA